MVSIELWEVCEYFVLVELCVVGDVCELCVGMVEWPRSV